MESENSLRGSVVALVTPLVAVAASTIAGFVSENLPGVQLDQNQIVAVMLAVITTVLGIGLKWLHGWQQHEQRVSDGKAAPVTTAKQMAASRTNGSKPTATRRRSASAAKS